MTTAFDEVIAVRGLGTPDADEVTITGADPVVSTRFKIGETAAAVLGGIGVAVNDIWELKTGERQKATVDVRHAAAALRSTGYLQKPGPDGAFKTIVNPAHELDDAGNAALPHQGWPLCPAAFQPAPPASAGAEAVGLRTEPSVHRARRREVGRNGPRKRHRRNSRLWRHGAFQ